MLRRKDSWCNKNWFILGNTGRSEKPKDARIKSGKYVISASNREC
jgi:hypothetical protein